jgi:hypothetical protein
MSKSQTGFAALGNCDDNVDIVELGKLLGRM